MILPTDFLVGNMITKHFTREQVQQLRFALESRRTCLLEVRDKAELSQDKAVYEVVVHDLQRVQELLQELQTESSPPPHG